ncbi:tetratricopeptide repeat protein [Altererythrobacter lauratis]|uniref:Tetratricopeptide repeat protein n=1 Tax=Alteraurantiacibacter lauratis TaxID=2054627 RepID=A0ABV7EBT9_9SPHN
MRHTPAALAVALLFAVSSSALLAQGPQPDPRAIALQTEGRALLDAGDAQGAIDAFEAALAIDPAYGALYIDLADASRSVGLPGKAIMYYRRALARDPDNLIALAGEGEALAEKGALESARENLSRLEALCGADCPETVALSAAIARGPLPRVLTAEALSPDAGVTAN